jgi:purine-nucleoside phosphorylase
MQGRLHGYEGHTPTEIAYPVQVMKTLGVKQLILTNASGGINTDFQVGDLMIIDDHINLTGKSPLIGANDDSLGCRFPDMTFAYTPSLRALADDCARKCGLTIRHGVYIGVNGPQFETPAEIRAFRTLGGDAVGMSTVFEVIAAAHCGLPLLGISMITNMAAGVLMQPLSGAEVNTIAEQRGGEMRRFIRCIVENLA